MKITLSSLEVYVMHYKPLSNRRKALLESLSEVGINAKWITDWDANELTGETLSQYYREDPAIWSDRIDWQGGYPFRRLRMSEISLAIKHLESMKDVIQRDLPYALFLEDDVVFDVDFTKKFDAYFSNCPDDFDFVFLGNGCNLRISNPDPLVNFYEKSNPISKCTDSFVISRRACESMLMNCIPISLPIDFEINNVAKCQNLNGYWIEPPLITQGSQNGLYRSEVQ